MDDPYNMYFTPDGRSAIVVAEALKRLDFRDPQTMALQSSLATPQCAGINHADFSIDGTLRHLHVRVPGQPGEDRHGRAQGPGISQALERRHAAGHPRVAGRQDLLRGRHEGGRRVRDRRRHLQGDRVHQDGDRTHGLYPSRDGTKLYVANRGSAHIGGPPHGKGSVSVIDFATRKIVANWPVPKGGSPDMGNVSADGKVLWLSGRYDNVVYAIDTTSGGSMTISRWARSPTASPCGRSPAVTRWAIPATCAN